MAKTALPAGEEAPGSQSSSTAIVKSKYEALRDKITNANDTVKKANDRKSELVADAVENDKLHKVAFGWVMKLRKMDPVARNELLFHFDVMCGYEDFAREDLLEDRAVGTPEGEPDMRPHHLKRAGASAATTVRDLAEKSGAKTAGTDPIDKVGRGNPDKLN